MRVLRVADLAMAPWKNGGGVTREVARTEDGAALIWRVSIADVSADGPFSAFPGMTRILTVIEGAGMRLVHAEGMIEALPLRPVRFDGGMPVRSEMIGGALRDLNLIFDPGRVAMSAEVLRPGRDVPAEGAHGMLVLSGGCHLPGHGGVEAGELALFDDGTSEGRIGGDCTAILWRCATSGGD